MINELTTYLMHIAPSLAVAILLLFYVHQRLAKMEDRILQMLDDCIHHVMEQDN